MTQLLYQARWDYQCIRHSSAEGDGGERKRPHYRIASVYEPERAIARTNEELPQEEQRAIARLIASAPRFLGALLNIKRLAGKSGDNDAEPYALLSLIEYEVYSALHTFTSKEGVTP